MASVTDIVNKAISTYFPNGNVPPDLGNYAIRMSVGQNSGNNNMGGGPNPARINAVIKSASENIPAYFQNAAQSYANTYGSLAASGQDTSSTVQLINDLVKSAPNYGVDATALSNTINTDTNSTIARIQNDTAPNLFDTVMKGVSAIVIAVAAPELAPEIGASLGLTGAAATAAGYATIGATTNAVNAAAAGASPSDIAKAGLTGAVTGAAGSAVSSAANAIVPDIGQTGAAVVGGAAKGAVAPALSGGNIGAGAAGGALGSALGTNIGGTVGNVIGGAAGSGTAAALSGGNIPASILTGAAGGALSNNTTSTTTTPTDTTPTTPETPTVPTAPETPTTPVAPIDTPATPTIPETPTTPPVDTTIPANTKDAGEIVVDANKPILDLINPTVPTIPTDTATPTTPIISAPPSTPPVDTIIPTNTKDVGEITVTANKDQPILDLISPTVPTPQPIVPPVNVAPITPPSNVNVPPNATDVGEITVTADKNKPILDLINPTTIPMTDVGTIDVTAPAIKDVGTIDVTAPAIKDVGEITIDATKDNAANTTVTASEDNVSSSNNTVSLLSPSVVPSKSTSTSKTPGSSSAALLGQALGTTQPDTSLVGGSPILDGEQGKRRNVWNTESLKSALGIV